MTIRRCETNLRFNVFYYKNVSINVTQIFCFVYIFYACNVVALSSLCCYRFSMNKDLYRMGQKSRLLILSEYANKTEKIGGT